ncbi:hypothetical protein FWH58_02110 [Candidatus Saccharibacteria bacterium]|nr:hypothetical protein [Candidatus Saccharibacteria bacterium]
MKQQSVVTLDPIERQQKKDPGIIGRALITRPHGGKPIRPMDKFGHYLFAGKQGGGKTISAIWYAEKLTKKYKAKKKNVILYSNLGLGFPIDKYTIFSTINSLPPNDTDIRIVIIDEIQAYFPKDTRDKQTLLEIDKLVGLFSQLRKRTTYVLSTAQIYGRVNKALREQCLFMCHCRKSKINNKIVTEFIDGDDILCDELGRWSGRPKFIYTHGLPKSKFDTKKIISA